jgi:predicted Zn finger-like uncharacterized protein
LSGESVDVVVVCEKCNTRFHLDDSRVPAVGARVRCSRCKHAFLVAPPRSGKEDAIEEVVAEVTGAGGTPVPEVTRDLEDAHADGAELEPRQEPVQFSTHDRGPGDFEEDWEFNDDSPSASPGEAEAPPSGLDEFDVSAPDLGAEPSPQEIAPGGAESAGEPEPETSPAEELRVDPVESIRVRDAGLDSLSSDDLGSPEEWDFVGTAEAELLPELAPQEEAPKSAVPSVEEASSDVPAPVLADSPTATSAAPAGPDRVALRARLAGLGAIACWALVALAFSVGMSAVFPQPSERSAGGEPAEIAVSGVALTASEVEGRLVENALVGNLLVVSGSLENRGGVSLRPGRAIWVQLVSAKGNPIDGATAAAGRALPHGRLREQDPEWLRRDLERSAMEIARRSLRPGESVRFDAVFESIPDAAAGWVIEASTSPLPPDPLNPLPSATPLAWE